MGDINEELKDKIVKAFKSVEEERLGIYLGRGVPTCPMFRGHLKSLLKFVKDNYLSKDEIVSDKDIGRIVCGVEAEFIDEGKPFSILLKEKLSGRVIKKQV